MQWKQNFIQNEYCRVDFRREKAMLHGVGCDIKNQSACDSWEFHTLWTQATTISHREQHAERTDNKLVEKVWKKLRRKFTEETNFTDIVKLIENNGVKCCTYDVMVG